MNIQPNIFNRINSFAEYQKKMADYENQIVKMMIGKEGQPIPCHVMIDVVVLKIKEGV